MSERTASTGKLIAFMIIGVAVVSVVSNYIEPNTKVKTDACQLEQGILGNFQAEKDTTMAPETIFFDSAGNKRRLTDLKGQGIILNFWASWCVPCVREMPQLDHLKILLIDNNIKVLAVSQDRHGAHLVKKFLTANKLYNLEALIDKNGELIRAVNGKGLPTTIMFDRNGQEFGRVIGVAEWNSPKVVAFIRECLGS